VGVDGFVLVHGSNLSVQCWDRVVEHVDAATVAVNLPGRGSRAAEILTLTLDDCVTAVIDSADKAGFTRFGLVGHSLGGVTITETAWRHPDRVAQLVYVGALVPAPGASAASIMFGSDLPADAPLIPTEERAKMFFANDMTAEQWAVVWQQFVPESAVLWNARLSGYPADVPMTFVSLTDDVGVPPELARQMIVNLGGRVDHRALSAGHLVMVTKPRELAEVINDIVNC
jgi:pimeloyl-ACP methyl ester carboxylesterase